jgi:hypothetical protein
VRATVTAPLMQAVRVEAAVLTPATGWSLGAMHAALSLVAAGGWVMFLGNREIR